MAKRKPASLARALSESEGPRVGNARRRDLLEIVVIAICAIFVDVEVEDIAE